MIASPMEATRSDGCCMLSVVFDSSPGIANSPGVEVELWGAARREGGGGKTYTVKGLYKETERETENVTK